MTVAQYFLLGAIGFIVTFYIGYLTMIKPALSNYRASDDDEPEADTDSLPCRLYRVEGRQVLVLPDECEFSISKVMVRRVSGAVVLYPASKTWADCAAMLAEEGASTLTQAIQSPDQKE